MRFAIVALLIGCGSSAETPADFAVSVEDMAVAANDLAPSSDLATADLGFIFCEHLHAALAGAPPSDCAVAYLVRLMQCFQPAGACGTAPVSNGPTNDYDSCWTSGAAFEHRYLLGNLSYFYAASGARCGRIHTDTGGPYGADFCVRTANYDCSFNAADMAGSGASYLGGAFTCPDGTNVATGNLFQCADVKLLLSPPCDGSADAGCVFPSF